MTELSLSIPALAKTAKRAATPAGFLRVFDDWCDAEALAAMESSIWDMYERSRRSSVASLSQGGWKSGEIFHDPAFATLGNEILNWTNLRNLSGWAMINANGSNHPRHFHQGAVMTGVFFVTIGDVDNPTPTTFETPSAEWGETLTIDPAPGRLLIFPGWLWHAVPPVVGETPRITIAFDAKR